MPPVYSKKFQRPLIHKGGGSRQPRTSPCEAECLVGNHIQQVHGLVAQGNATEALRWLHSRNPFPGLTGRVCPHPCENACNREEYDERVGVRSLERYAADNGEPCKFHPLKTNGMRVAVIGAGPAGLTSARFCALLGYMVDIYEKSPIMGGIPRQAIPEFRLPRDIVDRETARAIEGNVNVHTNMAIGEDVKIPDLLHNYDAVILTCGLGRDRILDIPGKEYLKLAVDWLKNTTMARKTLANKDIVILGGGGVAFDCAFTAKRLKAASVKMVFLESIDKLRVPEEEARQALQEQIELYPSYLAEKVEKRDKGFLVMANPIKDFYFDNGGNLHTEMADKKPLELRADLVICASGLLPEESVFSGLDIERTPKGHVRTDESGATSVPRLFAAGEIASGPSLVGTAIRNGRETAIALHKLLNNIPRDISISLDEENNIVLTEEDEGVAPHTVHASEIMNIEYHPHMARRQHSKKMALPGIVFHELEEGLSREAALEEGSRCMHCGHCMECGSCVEACPGHILEMEEDGPKVAYPSQCWHCGCCRIACPTSSISYKFPLTMMV